MRKLYLLLMGVVFLAAPALAQRTVSGTVTDEKGNPIERVSVVVKGTASGTITKADGTYTLTIPANARFLVFSAVDLLATEVTIGTQTTINVAMKGEDKIMSEVVVTGYGTQQKKAFTGAASKIDAKEFSTLVTPSVDRQLAGRAAGVQVSTPGGLVNTPARIRVRGQNSISGNLSPLIVVDGVPFITGNLAGTTNSNALGDINPNDIETIDVLKDGSATAIYGSRAAGGVIMITTKKGDKSGRVKVNYDANFGFSGVLKKFDLLNAEEFVLISNEKFANAGVLPRAFMDANNTNTDWQSEIFNDNAFAQTHNLSFQGGNQKTQYFASLGYTSQKGVIISNWNKTYRLRFNLDHEINKYVKFGNNLTLSRQEDQDQNNGANSLGGSVAATLRLLPNVSPYNSSHPTGFNIQHPTANSLGLGANTQVIDDNFFNVAATLRLNRQYSDKYRLVNNTYLEISPAKGLKIRSQFAWDFFTDYSLLSWDPRHGDGFSSVGIVQNISQFIQRSTWQNYINYNKSFGKHNFFLTAGHEIQEDQSKFQSATGSNISDIFFIKENLITGSASVQQVGGNIGKSAIESVFGRLNYDFNNKYFIQASIRRDGLSSLAKENRYGVFPGGSIGWRISQEEFWQASPFLSKFFTDVKLKASYAEVGNPIGGFPYLSTFANFPYGNINGLAVAQVGNRILQWESNNKLDIGAEFNIKGGRYNFSIDYFLNDLDDLVLAVPTPLSAGIPGNSIQQNIGTARNKGIEISAGGDIIRGKNFTWAINGNYTYVSNEVKSLYAVAGTEITELPPSGFNITKVGEPLNIIYGYRYAGVNSANGNPMYLNAADQLIQHNIPTGTYHFATDKNDPTLGATTSLTVADRTKLGLPVPTYFGSVSNTFTYKGLSLDVMVRYSGGNKIMNITRQTALMNNSFQNNGREILDRWTTPGQVTNVPRLVWGQGNNINQNNLAISRFVEDGDFIRLQNVVLSYSLDGKKLERASNGIIRSCRFYVQGQNLYVWTKYTGADPENASEAGLDDGVSPQVRVISFGLNLGF